MKRTMILLAALTAMFGCNPNIDVIDPEPEEVPVVLNAEVESVTLTGFDVTIDITEASSFYIANYKLSDFEGVTQEKIVEQLKTRVELGASWSSILKIGSQKVSFGNLMSDTEYRTVVFGIRGDGTVTTDAIILETHTPSFSAKLELVEQEPFSFTVEVTPDSKDVAWFGQVFIGDGGKVTDDTLLQYIRYFISSYHSEGQTFEDITSKGHGFFQDECEPGLKYIFTVVAVDKNLRVVSGVTRCTFEVGYDGIMMIDENSTDNIHTAIYAYDNAEVGVLLSYTGYDVITPGYANNAIGFNAHSQYGIDLYSLTDEVAAKVLALGRQDEFEYYTTNYPEYFQNCQSAGDYAYVLQWPETKTLCDYGNIWTRIPVENVVNDFGEDLDRVFFMATIEDLDDELNVYNREYCASRADFSDLGYEFTVKAPSMMAVKNSRICKERINVETGARITTERNVLGSVSRKSPRPIN